MKKKVFRYLGKTANKLDYYRFRIKQRTGLLGRPKILPYLGFGNEDCIYMRGQVLEDKGLATPDDDQNKWQNAKAMYKRYTSNETPRVQLRISFQGHATLAQTDSQGYFSLHLKNRQPYKHGNEWQPVKIELLDSVTEQQGLVSAVGEVLIAGEKNNMGIISDVDDTILVSRATKVYKKLQLMLFKNARTRLPFEGVAAFYRALYEGTNPFQINPIFYVSSSSWKLFDLLQDFCELQGIPKGPFLLRDSRMDQFKLITSLHEGHKLMQVKKIMNMYPYMQFILVGDSGQKDAEIYTEVTRRYPERVKTIYIRNVSGPGRAAEIQPLLEECREMGVEMLLVKDTVEAARHALSQGYISPESLPAIKGERKKDLEAPSHMEQMLQV
ncbi:App1 family protein [Nafulsella turpanensis]|uniref:App1 family protein n=1 Tax=Nafulsella turpanensis TaxID=1265690 RepID=UPI000346C524|nr:phosphatase domain-containing protein [Nafulsella turpanensis]